MAESQQGTNMGVSQFIDYALRPEMVLHDRYKIGQVLGKGGFGITYKALDIVLNIPVAIKEYFPDQGVTRDIEKSPMVIITMREKERIESDGEKFLEEARRLGRFVNEPGIVGVRDFFKENNTAYIVMEYLSGETLRDYLNREKVISVEKALDLLAPVMHSLDKVHKEGLIHRDISPENIFLTAQGAKLLDFGTARSSSQEQISKRTVMVKPGYAPAEQYDSESSQGPWSDVYSFSAVLYECVTGIQPQDSLHRMFTDSLLPPSQTGIVIAPETEKALMKGLALRKEDRYQTVQELAAGLGVPNNEEPKTPSRKAGHTMLASADDQELMNKVKEAYRQTIPSQTSPQLDEPPAPPRPPESQPMTVQPLPRQESAPRQTPTTNPSISPYTPQPDSSASKQRRERRKKNRERSSNKRTPFIFGGVALLLIVGIAFLFSSNTVTIDGKTYQKDDTTSVIEFHDANVTVGDIKKLAKFVDIQNLFFSNCQFEEDSVEALGQLENADRISFSYTFPKIVTDFQNVTILDLSLMEDIDSLDFLEHFPALVDFSLSISSDWEGKIEDFSPIGRLTNLESLSMDNVMARSGVTDLSFVSNLKELAYFRCEPGEINEYTKFSEEDLICDISPLANCTKLETVKLSNNRIRDLSAFSNCPDLHWLEISDNALTTVTGIEECTKLSHVYIPNNQIESLEPFAACEELDLLDVTNNYLSNLAGLENKPSLTTLYASNNQLTDIAALADAEGLMFFEAAHNSISDVTPLSGKRNMRRLDLDDNALTSLQGCEEMVNLEHLSAASNQIEDLSGIANCSALETVELSYNKLREIGTLGNSGASLKNLEAAHNEIETLAGLENCTVLQAVNLGNNKISDASPLKNAAETTILRIAHNQISDISPLSAMTQMVFLDAGDNRLRSIQGMEGMTQLCYIDLSRNEIEDISGFPQITHDRTFDLTGADFLRGMNINVSGYVIYLEHNKIQNISSLPTNGEYVLLSVYDNPLTGYENLSAFEYNLSIAGKGLYFPYEEDIDLTPMTELMERDSINARVYAVDVPLDKQGQWRREIKGDSWSDITFLTAEEADETLAALKPDAVATAPETDDGEESLETEDGEQIAETDDASAQSDDVIASGEGE